MLNRIHGFMPALLAPNGLSPAVSQPIFTRSAPAMPQEFLDAQLAIARGETPDYGALVGTVMGAVDALQRGITTSTSGFPVRENLEAVAKILVPTDTPMRNRLPRIPGAGTAAAWRQITSLGGGWGSSFDQPGGGSAVQVFFPETGAPGAVTTAYAPKSAAYKLMGTEGSVTGFAAAAGANFQDQIATEKRNALMNFMLLEEHALINGDATSTAAPWGDGSTNYAFNGILNLITTANGVPSAQVQTAVGALTFAHMDAQIRRVWNNGGGRMWILCNAQEALSIRNLASNASNGLYKIQSGAGNAVTVGLQITGYGHPLSGQVIDIIVDRFMPAGTMVFGSDQSPDGSATLQVGVLPQVQLPELAPNDRIEGYVVQELAPTIAAPQVYPFLVSVYEVLEMKNALVFAKSTGLTAV
jgi:hypothetical protein